MLREAEEKTNRLRCAADMLISAEFAAGASSRQASRSATMLAIEVG